MHPVDVVKVVNVLEEIRDELRKLNRANQQVVVYPTPEPQRFPHPTYEGQPGSAGVLPR